MAGGTLGGGEDDEIITDINVTPLVDVVLVLLIILMVTATAIVSKTIQVELPEAQTGAQGDTTPTTFAISIDAEGQLYLDRDPVTMDEMRARVRAAHEEDPEVRAIIAADGRIQHEAVIRVIDVLRQEQVTKFAFNVRPGDLSGGGDEGE
ncbi:MAG TPA: biopolymer transporter ExbD [Polyangiaceae bacterium LLY-WYZ-15_(1-7)]|nr:biopolymer transporter ExbD [Myxococcales bacterium]MAT28186.1 biopolymer transporter ExbD [Sandaracinus sp.]HJK94463.1 biopolymer transporter ExbD [Polyangiaceae bacterium LLY-WYZ-15_(1-7)]MBJ70947.1 biopolymer transporter ExbD [Sandaracinus sp.]HJL04544.1 biopolymer transporter ExbD [Polyangiaceae bacterium LLY-WYZ-15_(1-7)]